MEALQSRKDRLKPRTTHAAPWHQDPALWDDAASSAVLREEEEWDSFEGHEVVPGEKLEFSFSTTEYYGALGKGRWKPCVSE